MPNHYLTYLRFTDKPLAEEISDLLFKNDIDFRIEDTKAPFDPSFSFTSYDAEIELKLRQSDFAKADDILNSYYQQMLDELPVDYYLYNFSDAELQEIISKRDEWGNLDYVLARKLLEARGTPVTSDQEREITKTRLSELKKPDRLSNYWIIIGYILSLIGSLIGFFMGLTILLFKKTLPNGELIFAYDKFSREHALTITLISAFLLLMRVVIKLPLFYEMFIPLF